MNTFEKSYRIACFEIEWLAVYKTVRAVHVAGRSYRKNNFFWIEHGFIIMEIKRMKNGAGKKILTKC